MARRAGCRLALTLAMAAVSLGSTASAATRTWTGGTSGMWSTAGNWSGGVAPLPGDDLVFPVVASNRAMTNDLVAASFATVAFTGDGYSLGGNLVELENLAFSSVTTGAALTLPIRLGSIATISTAGAPVKLSGALDLMGFGLTVLGDGRLTIEGIISGSGSLTRAGGTGILELSGANSYAGATKVSSGVLRIASPSALGDPTTGTTVDTTGSLQLMSPTPMSIAEPLVLSSQAFASLSALTGAHTWSGPITLQTDSTIATSTSLTLSGAISGAGKLRTLGDMTLEGTSS